MKRVYLILTLFMASFFFVSLNEVKADTVDLVILEDEIAIVESGVFERIRELAIELSNSYNKHYIITVKNDDVSIDNIIVNLMDKVDHTIYFNGTSRTIQLNGIRRTEEYKYSSTTDELSLSSNNYYPGFTLLRTIDSSNVFSYKSYLDSNIELLTYTSSKDVIDNIHYKDFVYTVNLGDHYPSLYQLKQLQGSSSGDEDIERNDSLDSFYTLVIEKIQIFANSFISNNACLFIIGIITLIFVFELVRRWLL